MSKRKEQKGIHAIVNVLLGLIIVAITAIIIMILISTKSSFRTTITEPKHSTNEEAVTESVWDVSFKVNDIVVERDAVVIEEETQEEAQEDSQDYIFADSDSRYLTEEEIRDLSQEEMRIARNEIYARHGRIFADEGLSKYFNSKSWYQPLYTGEEMDEMGDAIFNEYEYANKTLITEIEEELGYR